MTKSKCDKFMRSYPELEKRYGNSLPTTNVNLKELRNVKLKEIEDRLYSLNAQISLKWIGMRQTPKDTEITLLNRALGEIIKQIREIRENEE